MAIGMPTGKNRPSSQKQKGGRGGKESSILFYYNNLNQLWVLYLNQLCVCVCVCVLGGGGGKESSILLLYLNKLSIVCKNFTHRLYSVHAMWIFLCFCPEI